MYFGVMPPMLEVGECGGQRVHPHTLMVERDADRIDPEPGQPVQRSLIGFPLDDHGVAARQQGLVDEIERLQRAGNDQDVVGGAVHSGVPLQLGGEKFTQRPVALRTAGEPIGGERPAFALQNGIDRVDQAFDRDLVGVVVAADEAVSGKARPPRRGRGQPGRKQRREVEHCGHERHLPYSFVPATMTIATGLRQRFSGGLNRAAKDAIERCSGGIMPCVMKLAQVRQPG